MLLPEGGGMSQAVGSRNLLSNIIIILHESRDYYWPPFPYLPRASSCWDYILASIIIKPWNMIMLAHSGRLWSEKLIVMMFIQLSSHFDYILPSTWPIYPNKSLNCAFSERQHVKYLSALTERGVRYYIWIRSEQHYSATDVLSMVMIRYHQSQIIMLSILK